jgi:hypothetical protein
VDQLRGKWVYYGRVKGVLEVARKEEAIGRCLVRIEV